MFTVQVEGGKTERQAWWVVSAHNPVPGRQTQEDDKLEAPFHTPEEYERTQESISKKIKNKSEGGTGQGMGKLSLNQG